MDFQVHLTSESGMYDISQITGQVEFTDNINKAGVCTFPVMMDGGIIPAEGNGIRIVCEGEIYFVGNIFKTAAFQDGQMKVTCYDQLRYLKADETYVFDGKTASDVVRQICGDFGLAMGEIEDTGYNPGKRIFDSKDVLDTISDYIKMTLVAKKEIYYIKDIAGKICLKNIRNSIPSLIISPESLMTGYSYGRSIDDETYNKIKLVRDNKESGKRELYVAQDSGNIKKWGGILQYYEKLDDQVNPAEAKAKADALLYLKNRVQQSLSVDVMGEKDIRAGNMLYTELLEAGLKKFLLCTAARHSFTNQAHTVKIDLRLV